MSRTLKIASFCACAFTKKDLGKALSMGLQPSLFLLSLYFPRLLLSRCAPNSWRNFPFLCPLIGPKLFARPMGTQNGNHMTNFMAHQEDQYIQGWHAFFTHLEDNFIFEDIGSLQVKVSHQVTKWRSCMEQKKHPKSKPHGCCSDFIQTHKHFFVLRDKSCDEDSVPQINWQGSTVPKSQHEQQGQKN